jgi:argininosuccinate lyase
VVPAADAAAIVEGLRAILAEAEAGRLSLTGDHEDVHSFLEAALYERIGAAAGRLHTGRSRNDQVVTAFRLYVKEQLVEIAGGVHALIAAALHRAAGAVEVILPAFTHLQHAQPVRLAHHLLAYVWMLDRDAARLQQAFAAADALPLGSGAVAGAGVPLDRRRTAQRLGFGRITENSVDAVGDRDFAVEAAAAAALLCAHLSRWADELVLWATEEFGFVALADRVATGSSLMPQKKNPDPAELIRGRAARAAGGVVALLALLKGLPAGYHRDLQEDKPATFEALDLALASVRAMHAFLQGVRFVPERMETAARRGWLTATEAADYLVRRGVPFREAHALAGAVVRRAAGRDVPLWELPLADYQAVSPLFGPDVLDAVTLEAAVEAKDVPGGTARRRVLEQLDQARARAAAHERWLAEARESLRAARGLAAEEGR